MTRARATGWFHSSTGSCDGGRPPTRAATRAIGVSVATANHEWAVAKSWLYRRLKKKEG